MSKDETRKKKSIIQKDLKDFRAGESKRKNN